MLILEVILLAFLIFRPRRPKGFNGVGCGMKNGQLIVADTTQLRETNHVMFLLPLSTQFSFRVCNSLSEGGHGWIGPFLSEKVGTSA